MPTFSSRLLLLLAGLLPLTLHATEPEQLLVTASRAYQPASDIPVNIQVVDKLEIERSGVTNIADLLNAQAGIQVRDDIGNRSRGAVISMSGFGENASNNVLILVNGRKLNNPSLAAADLASIQLQTIERIEILQGSAGVLYGDQASGGVINIITRQAEELQFDINTTIGSDDLQRLQSSVSQKVGVFSYQLAAEKASADNYRDNNHSDYGNLWLSTGLDFSRFRVNLDWQTINDDLRLPGDLSSNEVRQNRRQTQTPDDYSNVSTDNLQIGMELDIGKHWQLLLDTSKRDADTRGFLFGGHFSSATEVSTVEPRISANIPFNDSQLLLTAGIDWEGAYYEYLSAFGRTAVDQQELDGYWQLVVPLNQRLSVSGGMRYSAIEEDNQSSDEPYDDSLTVYQVGLNLQATEQLRLFLRYDQGFRWPNVDENGLIAPDIDYLKPQQSATTEFGVDMELQSFSFSWLLYHMSIEDEILYDPNAAGPSSIFGFDGANINLDRSRRLGMVFNSRWQISSQWQLQFNASLVDAEFADGEYDGNTVPASAGESANLILSYQLTPQLSIYTDAQYTGKQYYAGDMANDFDELGGYTVVNASIRYAANGFYGQLRLNNLGDKQYNGASFAQAPFSLPPDSDGNYPAPERTVSLTLGYQF